MIRLATSRTASPNEMFCPLPHFLSILSLLAAGRNTSETDGKTDGSGLYDNFWGIAGVRALPRPYHDKP